MKVVTAVVNNPVFIQIQYYTLQKYIKCHYEFIVFNDAKSFCDYSNGGDISINNSIQELCKTLNIQCINIPNQHHIKTLPSFHTSVCHCISTFLLLFCRLLPLSLSLLCHYFNVVLMDY